MVKIQIHASNIMLDASYVAMRADSRPGPYVMFTVTDTGLGIPTEVLDRIFDPFFSTKDSGKGAGLGLSISHTIVEAHHGRILLDSIEGQGATFTVVLPAASAPAHLS